MCYIINKFFGLGCIQYGLNTCSLTIACMQFIKFSLSHCKAKIIIIDKWQMKAIVIYHHITVFLHLEMVMWIFAFLGSLMPLFITFRTNERPFQIFVSYSDVNDIC